MIKLYFRQNKSDKYALEYFQKQLRLDTKHSLQCSNQTPSLVKLRRKDFVTEKQMKYSYLWVKRDAEATRGRIIRIDRTHKGKLGEGVHAIVKTGWDINTGEKVAIKIQHYRHDIEDQIQTEIDTATKFNMVLGSGIETTKSKKNATKFYANNPELKQTINKKFYTVMPYLDGINLSEYLHELSNNTLSESYQAIDPLLIVVNLLAQMKNMHDKGIVHMDLHSDNIKINKQGGVDIIDYGCAIKLDANSDKKNDISQINPKDEGSTAPELWQDGIVSGKADVWKVSDYLKTIAYHLRDNVYHKRPPKQARRQYMAFQRTIELSDTDDWEQRPSAKLLHTKALDFLNKLPKPNPLFAEGKPKPLAYQAVSETNKDKILATPVAIADPPATPPPPKSNS